MKLTDCVHLVGSGSLGFRLTDDYDCNVFLVDGGDELALVDIGAGMGVDQILSNVRDSGFDPGRIRYLLLTHGHGDHAGGTAHLRDRLPDVEVLASPFVARVGETADEQAINLHLARNAGIYPADYRLRPFRVDRVLSEGHSVQVGRLSLRVYETPGHCEGHLSFSFEAGGQNYLVGGDLVFWGGKILIQYIHDCNLLEYGRSMEKFRHARVDVLLPGHLTCALRSGQEHIDRALAAFDRLQIPHNVG